MVFYNCNRCGYNTNHKSKYINHLKRKFLCKNLVSDDNLNEEYIKYNITDKIIYDYQCQYCNKKFNRKYNLERHEENCQENKLLNKYIKEVEDLKKEISKIKNVNIQVIHNQQNIGIQNINILAFNKEDLSHLTNKDFINCFNRYNMVIPNLIKKIHCNPIKPENHNIYISNLQNKYIMIYNGDNWELKNKDYVIDELMDNNEIILNQKLEEWIENGKNYPLIMKKFKRYLEQKENDIIKNKIKDEIKLLLYNNKNLIKKTIENI